MKSWQKTYKLDEECKWPIEPCNDLELRLCALAGGDGRLHQLVRRVHQVTQPRAHRLLLWLALAQCGAAVVCCSRKVWHLEVLFWVLCLEWTTPQIEAIFSVSLLAKEGCVWLGYVGFGMKCYHLLVKCLFIFWPSNLCKATVWPL